MKDDRKPLSPEFELMPEPVSHYNDLMAADRAYQNYYWQLDELKRRPTSRVSPGPYQKLKEKYPNAF